MRLAALTAGLTLGLACSSPSAPSPTPLANTFESAEALATALLGRLAARDSQAVAAMALTEAEFRDHVWPELPASLPERNVPFEYAWGQMKQRSDASLAGILGRYGGRTLTLRAVAFTGETTTYRTFVVRRDSEIVAADETGREWILRLFGSMLVKDGRHKVFSFVVDD
jgi:hypothetical protein